MATAQIDTVVRHLRRAVWRQDGAGCTDAQLLASFIDGKDEAAFEAIVRRHGPMVFGVCRRVTRNHHDAEDAFQATILILARKASSVHPRERVANWLHGVALRTAMKAKAMTAKRRGREKQITDMPEHEQPPLGEWRDVESLLDRELNGLPENYRLPIVLCDLEGRTIKEATQRLGWPQGTLAGRLARGRKLLAKRLANRGVVLSAGSLAAVVSQAASAAMPISLMSSTVKAATIIAAGKATVVGVIPAKVVLLTEGVMKAMFLYQLKNLSVALLVLLGVGAFGGAMVYQATGQEVSAKAGDRPMNRNSDTKSDKPSTEMKKLEGKWNVIWHEDTGEVISVDRYKESDYILVISGDMWIEQNRKETVLESQVKLSDPGDGRKRLDLFDAGKTNDGSRRNRCIYELVGDSLLVVCQSYPGEARPTAFTTQPKMKQTLTIYKKQPR